MTDKEERKEEKKEEEKKEEKKEVKKEPEQKAHPQKIPEGKAQKEVLQEQAVKESAKETAKAAVAPKDKAQKRKKINRMRLEEIDKRLQDLETKGGGLSSLYAQHLLERKKELQA